MRIVFMGSADISGACLQKLVEAGREVALVVSQPDRPAGRGKKMCACLCSGKAYELGLKCICPESVNNEEAAEVLKAVGADVFVVVAYGQILKKYILEIPPKGCVNVHVSLLPRHRGAAPVQHAILAGDTHTGVTTMFMDEGMDTGDIILQRQVEIGPLETAGELHERLLGEGADLLLETLDLIEQGKAPRLKQDLSKATYAGKINKSDARIDWSQTALQINNKVRAFNPKPVCWSSVVAKNACTRIRVFRSAVGEKHGEPGEVLSTDGGVIEIAAGKGSLKLIEVQIEGGKRMEASDFLRGYPIAVGSRFE